MNPTYTCSALATAAPSYISSLNEVFKKFNQGFFNKALDSSTQPWNRHGPIEDNIQTLFFCGAILGIQQEWRSRMKTSSDQKQRHPRTTRTTFREEVKLDEEDHPWKAAEYPREWFSYDLYMYLASVYFKAFFQALLFLWTIFMIYWRFRRSTRNLLQ